MLTYPACRLLGTSEAPMGMTPFEFRRYPCRQLRTKVSGLSCGVVCVILRLAILVEQRLVTDGRTDTWRQHIPR